MPTVNWTFWEASTINSVVADLLRLQSLFNRQFNTTSSFFYRPGTKKTMADDASRQFRLAPDILLSLFSPTYSPQQSPGMWHACHPPPKIVSLVISRMRNQPFEVGMSPVIRRPRNIMTRHPSAPKCSCTT